MTVNVTQSSFNIRERLKQLEKPIGIKGDELMRAETAQEARDLVSAGRKNFLYNGDMQIWQRGTLFPNGGGGGAVNYTADRWNATRYASSENDVGREDANYLGFRYCLRSARGGGDTTTTARFVSQVLEQRDTWKLRGKYVTFSFYVRVGSGFNGGLVKSSITYHTDSAREERFYYNQFINGNNTQSRIEHKSLSVDWQRFTHTTYIPDNAQQVGVAIESNENLPNAVSADYFEITGCQLEVGRNATEFEHRSHGQELELCQRYFYKLSRDTTGSRVAGAVLRNNTQAYGFGRSHPTPMRISPAITSSGLEFFKGDVSSSITAGFDGGPYGFSIDGTASSSLTATDGDDVMIHFANGNSYIDLNAEL